MLEEKAVGVEMWESLWREKALECDFQICRQDLSLNGPHLGRSLAAEDLR